MEHELVVRFVVQHVSHAHELGMAAEPVQLRFQRGRAQIHPSDDTLDESMGASKLEEPLRFCHGLSSLHGDGAIEFQRSKVRLKIGREIIPSQQGHGLCYPAGPGWVILPEMLVGIDAHKTPHELTLTATPAKRNLDLTADHIQAR